MKKILLLGFVVYLITAGASYALFSQQPQLTQGGSSDTPKADGGKVTNDYEALTFEGPKTEACPLTGELYPKDQRAWWESHRPLGVMIENHLDSRPQSGIQAADVTYEAVAEGGITRTLNVYYCQDAGIVGPVRSARTYFLDFVSEYGEFPLYAHVGGANTPGPANALGQINDYGWGSYNDLSQFSIGFPTFKRDESRLGREVATEHTMYSVTSKLWEVGEERGLTNIDKDGVEWNENFKAHTFKDAPAEGSRPKSQTVTIDYWNGADYGVIWTYDPKSNLYMRDNGGEPHIDRNTKKQLSATTVAVLFMTEGRANDGYEGNAHMLYGTKGTGEALIFMDGKQTKGTWEKEERTSRLILTDTSGKEITYTKGKIWYNVQPKGDTVAVK
jgi:hypothetical protein